MPAPGTPLSNSGFAFSGWPIVAFKAGFDASGSLMLCAPGPGFLFLLTFARIASLGP